VTAGFIPRHSWVKRVIVRDSLESARVLRHEQLHFDLTELHARHMRRRIADFARPCTHSDAQLEAMAQRVVHDERAEQRRYDAETRNGLIAERQSQWERETARQLRATVRYAP
jgi:predicted secreted Zn-dependent protease